MTRSLFDGRGSNWDVHAGTRWQLSLGKKIRDSKIVGLAYPVSAKEMRRSVRGDTRCAKKDLG